MLKRISLALDILALIALVLYAVSDNRLLEVVCAGVIIVTLITDAVHMAAKKTK